MVNSETTLKEFILSIPACYGDCSLENWIFAMNKSDLGMIALLDREGKPQRLLQNHRLLSALAGKRLGSQESQKIEQNLNAAYLEQITVPVIALSSQMKIQTLLARHHQEPQENYFIVDEVGKLLGVLDFSKLSQILWSESNLNEEKKPSVSYAVKSLAKKKELISPDIANRNKSSISNRYSDKSKLGATDNKLEKLIIDRAEFRAINPTLYACLMQISAPLAIKNARGEICYQNELWHRTNKSQKDIRESLIVKEEVTSRDFATIQENFNNISEKAKQISVPISPSINLAYEPKQSNRKNNQLDNQTISFDSYHCATANNNLAVVTSISNQLKKQVKQLNLFSEKATVDEKILATTPIEERIEENDKEPAISWHYYRLPLEIKSDFVKVTESPNYWLVFATPFSLQQSSIKDSEQQRQFLLEQLQSEFLLNISHDIKSPLTTIIGLSSLLKEEKLGTLNTSQVRYSQMIYHSGKRLISLINDFLEIIHLNTRKLQSDFESIELENICQHIYHQVTEKFKAVAAIKQNKVPLFPELQLDVASNAQTVMADKAYFCQILTRLLENALNFTSSEELLGITAEHWSNNWLAITVWNEGGGFSEAQQNVLNRGFSQYATFLASQEKDRELGLILAQQLAQANGGDISFISQTNYGSEFTLLLPLQNHQKQLKNDSLSQEIYSEPNNNSLVLIIETAPKRIIDLNEKLKSLGYHCAIARNHAEALYKARCLEPCKIILNSAFLETNEPNLVKFLKTEPITSTIPLLITTSNSFLDDSLANLVDGTIGFPVTRANLTQFFTPIVPRQSVLTQNLTVLRLSIREEIGQTKENLALDFVFENPSFSICHHIIEADSLEQAKLLVDIWDIDVIIWDGATLKSPETYLQSFAQSDVLASIPIITLDAQTTAAANKIFNLAVFPCLLPANQRSIQQLTQVIQIAAGFG